MMTVLHKLPRVCISLVYLISESPVCAIILSEKVVFGGIPMQAPAFGVGATNVGALLQGPSFV